MNNPILDAIKSFRNRPDEVESEERKPTSSRRWTDAFKSFWDIRAQKRRQQADVDASYRKQMKRAKADRRQLQRHNQHAAVTVLRAFERAEGLEPGGLMQRLVDEGKLSGTRDKVVDWEKKIIETPDGNEIESNIPVIRKVPAGYSPAEILAAAGLTPEKIAELNEQHAQAVSA